MKEAYLFLICFISVCGVSLTAQTKIDSVAGVYEHCTPTSPNIVPVDYIPVITINITKDTLSVHNTPNLIVKSRSPEEGCMTFRRLTLAKNKCARLYTHPRYYLKYKLAEYGKWKMKGDTVIVTFSKSQGGFPLRLINVKKGDIEKMEQLRVVYFLYTDGFLEELAEDAPSGLFGKKELP